MATCMPPASSTVMWKSTCSMPVTCTSSMVSRPQVRVTTSSTGTSMFITKLVARAWAIAGSMARIVVAASVSRRGSVSDMAQRPLYGCVLWSPPHPRSAHMAIDVPDSWGLEGKVAIVSGGGAAGVGGRRSVVEEPEGNWRRVMQVNVETMFLTAKHAIPAMLRNRGGAIVNVSSISALRPRGLTTYSVSKGAVIALTQAMAVDHG